MGYKAIGEVLERYGFVRQFSVDDPNWLVSVTMGRWANEGERLLKEGKSIGSKHEVAIIAVQLRDELSASGVKTTLIETIKECLLKDPEERTHGYLAEILRLTPEEYRKLEKNIGWR